MASLWGCDMGINSNSDKLYSHLKSVVANSPFYAGYRPFFHADMADGYAALLNFPIMSKSDMVRNHDALLSNIVRGYPVIATDGLFTVRIGEDLNKALIPEITSGSSGFPLKCYKTNEERVRLAISAWRRRMVFDPALRQQDIFCLIHAHASQPKVVSDPRNFHPDNIKKVLDFLVNEVKPRMLHGTPSDLLEYARFINKIGYDLKDWVLSFVESNSEYLDPDHKAEIESAFQAKVINNYGALEFWNIAYECRSGHLHVNPDIVIEVIDPVTGHPDQRQSETGSTDAAPIGDIVVTSLILKALPFIRYKIGDLGSLSFVNCECGSKEPIINLHHARKINLINRFQSDKKMVNGVSLFKGVIWDVLAKHDLHIKRYKVVQTKQDHFNVYVTLPDAQLNIFSSSFEINAVRRLEQEANFSFMLVDEGDSIYKGKNYSFVCHVN